MSLSTFFERVPTQDPYYFANELLSTLEEFVVAESVEEERQHLPIVKERSIAYLKKCFTEKDETICELVTTYFIVAEGACSLHNAQGLKKDTPDISKVDNLNYLCSSRNALYFQQQLHYY